MMQFSHNGSTPRQQNLFVATSGVFIPSDYNKIITTPSGRPNSTAVNLLAEIVYLHKPSKYGGDKKFSGDLLSLRYSDLETKFNKSHETIRKAFKKLESLGLIQRSYKKVSLKNTTCSNVLFIEFNKEKYNSLINTTEYPNTRPILEEKNFCALLENVDSSPQKCGDVYREKKERNKEAISYGLSFFSFNFKKDFHQESTSLDNSNGTSVSFRNGFRLSNASVNSEQSPILPEKTEETPNKCKILQENIYIENSKNVVVASNSSNSFTRLKSINLNLSCSNLAQENRLGQNEIQELKSTKTAYPTKRAAETETSAMKEYSVSSTLSTTAPLKSFEDYKYHSPTEFLRLDPEFCDQLRSETGKNFPNSYFENVVIKLLAEDRKKHGDKLKWRKIQLFARLVAWANRELKDLDSILAECGIKSSEELKIAKSVERQEAGIVARCENSKDISPIGTLKRKIAGSMDQKMAAFLLQNASFEICSFTEKVTTKILSCDQETKEFVDPESGKSQVLEKILTDIAKGMLGQGASSEIIYDFEKNGISRDLGLYGLLGSTGPSKNQITYSEKELYRNVQESLYNKFGDGIYKSWFSKLEFYRIKESVNLSMSSNKVATDREYSKHIFLERVPENPLIYVTAPTIFMRDWVKSNYADAIEECFKQNNTEILNIKCLTTEEFREALLDPLGNNGSGLEIIDSSVTLQNPKNSEDSGSQESSVGEGGAYYHEVSSDRICIAS